MPKEKLERLIIHESCTLRQAIKAMDSARSGFVGIIDSEKKLKGVLCFADFRSVILDGVNLDNPVADYMNKDFCKIYESEVSSSRISEIFNKHSFHHLPVLNRDDVIVDLIFSSEFFSKDALKEKIDGFDVPVAIMAGGKGERLDPFTRILPKALIPLGKKAIIETIMDKYAEYGVSQFYISLNYKGQMIKAYFDDIKTKHHIRYIHENKPLGTAGSLKYLEDRIEGPFFVSNCDIIVEADYSEVLQFHEKNGNQMTIVGAIMHHSIPYGICKITNGGGLIKITEKPEYDFLVNTGMYLLNHTMLEFIPENEACDITDLIDMLLKHGKKIGVFPVSERSWLDIGELESFKKYLSAPK
jgi:dTDP-glucose pyrophosphorylase